MAYRDDLAAAQAKNDELEREIEEAKEKIAQLEALVDDRVEHVDFLGNRRTVLSDVPFATAFALDDRCFYVATGFSLLALLPTEVSSAGSASPMQVELGRVMTTHRAHGRMRLARRRVDGLCFLVPYLDSRCRFRKRGWRHVVRLRVFT